MEKLNALVISDVHFGAIKPQKLYNELKETFLAKIKSMDSLDFVFIAGDLFDRKLSFNEEHSKYVIKFITELGTLSIKKKFKIRLVKGTRNHDLNQLNNFSYLEASKKIDFKIINNVYEESFFKDTFKILYIPEEYMDNMEDYYKDTLYNEEKKYDLIIGHGCMEFQSFDNLNQSSEKRVANAPTFKNDLMMEKSNVTIFGHIHNRCNFKNQLYYCGSFSRWIFGEEKEKGFIHLTYDLEEKSYEVNYINNTLADEYNTIDLNEVINNDELSIDQKIKHIEDIKKLNDGKFIKIKYKVSDIVDENHIIKNYFADDANVTIASKRSRIKTDDSEKEILKEYGFIFDKKYSLEETISKFIKKKNGIDMSVETIKDLLNNDL